MLCCRDCEGFMNFLEILILIYVAFNVPIAIWHLVICIKKERDQHFLTHLKESIKNRDATITRQEQQLARTEKRLFEMEKK